LRGAVCPDLAPGEALQKLPGPGRRQGRAGAAAHGRAPSGSASANLLTVWLSPLALLEPVVILVAANFRCAKLTTVARLIGEWEDTMRTRCTIALALLAGVGIGTVAVQSLHAQAQPPIYLVTEIDVTDPDAYGTEYAPKFQASIKAAGGRIIALGGAGGAGAKFVTQVEGQPPKRVVIQVWDSGQKMQAWRSSDDYREARKIGDQYAKFRSYAVDGL
jgi:uncharacterized protein (DUF1330 family)